MLLRHAVVCGLFCATALAQRRVIDDAEAKKTFESVCSGCHSLQLSTGRRATHDEWMDLVARMADKGATATDDQYFAIVDYLTKTYGPARLNVNRAEAADLAAFFAISEADG
jgi:mono/diheme cytochrome c family protein